MFVKSKKKLLINTKFQCLKKIENSSDFVEFVHDVMLRFKDKDEGRRLLEKAEEKAENSSDFVKIANSVILDIVDKDRGRRLFEKAEDTAKTPEDVRKLKLNQNELR